MIKKNIILFTGVNTVFLERDLTSWKDIFVEKHGEINLISSPADRDARSTINECLTPGFMGSPRMILLHDFPRSTAKTVEAKIKEQNELLEELIEKHIHDIPETNFIVCIQPKPNKQTRFYKGISKEITIKDYPDPTPQQVQSFIQEHIQIELPAMRELISRTHGDLASIAGYVHKLQLYKPDSTVTMTDIRNYVTSDLESTIFVFLDALFQKKPSAAKDFQTILQASNVYAVYAGMMTNIRKIIYACIFLKQGVPEKSIAQLLKISPYTISKNRYLIGQIDDVTQWYTQLLQYEYSVKTGLHPDTSSDTGFEELISNHILKYIRT